jgi:hypothetical protein
MMSTVDRVLGRLRDPDAKLARLLDAGLGDQLAEQPVIDCAVGRSSRAKICDLASDNSKQRMRSGQAASCIRDVGGRPVQFLRRRVRQQPAQRPAGGEIQMRSSAFGPGLAIDGGEVERTWR